MSDAFDTIVKFVLPILLEYAECKTCKDQGFLYKDTLTDSKTNCPNCALGKK